MCDRPCQGMEDLRGTFATVIRGMVRTLSRDQRSYRGQGSKLSPQTEGDGLHIELRQVDYTEVSILEGAILTNNKPTDTGTS